MAVRRTHVVFGSSPAGMLRETLWELGRREKVLDPMDHMSFGPIAPGHPDIRIKWMERELNSPDWRELVSGDPAFLSRSSSAPGPLIAWYDPLDVDSYAGFHWWLTEIGDLPLSTMEVTRLGWLGLEPMSSLIGNEIPLGRVERDAFLARWRQLQAENAPLRIIENGRLVSVSIDYFDEDLLEHVKPTWVSMSRITGEARYSILEARGHKVSTFILIGRVAALERAGILEADGDIHWIDDCRIRRVRHA